jgi:hypothetical protein
MTAFGARVSHTSRHSGTLNRKCHFSVTRGDPIARTRISPMGADLVTLHMIAWGWVKVANRSAHALQIDHPSFSSPEEGT